MMMMMKWPPHHSLMPKTLVLFRLVGKVARHWSGHFSTSGVAKRLSLDYSLDLELLMQQIEGSVAVIGGRDIFGWQHTRPLLEIS
jgi:hypothetical protein